MSFVHGKGSVVFLGGSALSAYSASRAVFVNGTY